MPTGSTLFLKGGLAATLLCFTACGADAKTGEAASETISSAEFYVQPKPLLAHVNKADILFVIDNSNSMFDEQVALRAQFPRLISALTHGERFPGDPHPFEPVADLHIGVVSTDMGTPGFEIGSCQPNGGDDGRLQHTPVMGAEGQACAASYPPYLSANPRSQADVDQLSHDFSCIAQLGTGGCGFEEQLEAPLKALWPATYIDDQGREITPNPLLFLLGSGHGDQPAALGGNLGFSRDAGDDPSLLVIVLVTDEDDCSPKQTDFLKPAALLPPDSPYRAEPDLNLRCHQHPEALFDLRDRYLSAFRALRPGHEELVVFSAIVGVPTDLVDQSALAAVEWDDDAQRDAFYETLLNDPRMQEVPDPTTPLGTGLGNLTPACRRPLQDSSAISTAYPARRIVSLAQAFGEHGMVQSICQDDFSPAVDSILTMMSRSFTAR